MTSKRRTAAPSSGRGGSTREENAIEIDPAYARTVGVTEGVKVSSCGRRGIEEALELIMSSTYH